MKKIYQSLYRRVRAVYYRVFERDFLRRIVRNSSYLVSASFLSAGMGMVQNIFMFRILQPVGMGLVAAITTFTNVINRLTSFRIHELVVRYVRLYEEQNKKNHAAAVFRLAVIFEGIGALVAYFLIIVLAPLGVQLFSDEPNTEKWFMVFGLLILFNLMFDSSDGLLQVYDKFNWKAMVDIGQSIVRVVLTIVVFYMGGGLFEFILAELTGRLVRAIAYSGLALKTAHQQWGTGWWRVSWRTLREDRRELFRFAFSTNLSASISLVAKDSEGLWVNAFLGNLIGGYYEAAKTLIGLIQIPISPLPATTYPELSQAVAKEDWNAVQVILRRGSFLAYMYSFPIAVILIVFGKMFILILNGPLYLPAYWPLVILVVGYTFSNIFYWNRAALLAFNRPVFPTIVNFVGMVLKVLGVFLFAESFGAEGFAALLAGYYILTVGVAALRVRMDVRQRLKSLEAAA